jgi:hypothetical protein
MATLLEDINTYSDWIIQAFAADQLKLDHSIQSFIEIDKFFNKHVKDGKAVEGGRFTQNRGAILFSLGAYVGQTIIKNVPGSEWITDDNDPQGEVTATLQLPDGMHLFPMQRMIKRFQDGPEDAIYPYGYTLTSKYTGQPFDRSFWQIMSDNEKKD